MKNVSFIPAQMDGVASTSTEAARDNPLRLLVRDAGVLFTNLPYLPWIILPFKTSDPSAELYLGKSNTRDTVVQVWLLFLETILLLLAIPSILVLPGGISVLAACLCCAMIQAICLPLQGSRIVHSTMDSKTVKAAKQHQDERWIFINGCMTGYDPQDICQPAPPQLTSFQARWFAKQLQPPCKNIRPSCRRYS